MRNRERLCARRSALAYARSGPLIVSNFFLDFSIIRPRWLLTPLGIARVYARRATE